MTTAVKKKHKGGRRKKVFTKKEIADVERLAQYLTIQQMAAYFGICEATFHVIKNRQTTVSRAYKKGQQGGIIAAASTLMEKIKQGDTTSIIFYLKTQAGWSEKQPKEEKSTTPITLPSITVNVRSKDIQTGD